MRTLTASKLSVHVGDKVLLHPTSLNFNNGCLAAIVGPNGAGKSTFAKALLGLTTHTGDVFLDDSPLTKFSPKERAKAIAYLPQGQGHAWPLPVSDVVALGRYPHQESQQSSDDVVGRLLARLELDGLRHQSVLTLSGGEQMRVSMARALAVEASFLLADEPLASLDPHHQFAMMDVLRAEADNGLGVVVILHDLRLAALYADRIILLNEGRIVADGVPHDVLTESTVTDIFAVRSQVEEVERIDGSQVSVALPIPGMASQA